MISQCIFCKRKDRSFRSEEHIFPESLGNKNLILPKGIVCDQCNNERLAQLDAVLLDFPVVSVMKNYYNIPSKTGRVPEAKLTNVVIRSVDKKNLSIRISHKKFLKTYDNKINIKMLSRPFLKKYLCNLMRSFFKIALEMIHFDHGYSLSLDEAYDPIRKKILTKEYFPGFIAHDRTIKPIPSCRFTHRFFYIGDEKLTSCELNLFGMSFRYCLEYEQIEFPEVLKQYPNISLIEF